MMYGNIQTGSTFELDRMAHSARQLTCACTVHFEPRGFATLYVAGSSSCSVATSSSVKLIYCNVDPDLL